MSKPTVPALLVVAAIVATGLSARASQAQVVNAPLPVVGAPPPVSEVQPSRMYDPTELDRIVSPIALYPDPLLAQVLSAATYASEIPVAMQWVDARRGRTAEQLTAALSVEQVPWDPSVQALVAFPTVLHTMATSMPWTTEVGDAFRAQPSDVMDAVQRLRSQARRYGYLNSTSQLQVVESQGIEILPVNPSYVVVPYYNPVIVFAPPRPRFLVSSAIYLGFGVRLGNWYEPWGYRTAGFYWPMHNVVVGYPGWNRAHVRRDVVYTGYNNYNNYDNRYAVTRYEPRAVQVRGNGYTERGSTYQPRGERGTTVWAQNYGRGSSNDDRNRDYRSRGNPGYDGNSGRGSRDNRDDQWPGRTSQPRPAQAAPRSDGPRAAPQAQPHHVGEQQRVARRKN
ncbi:MAG: DUF3300 domain-containing protein [bacterium]